MEDKLNEILMQTIQFSMLGNFPEAVPKHKNWVNVMGKVYAFSFDYTKQAILELFRTREADIRIDELKLMPHQQIPSEHVFEGKELVSCNCYKGRRIKQIREQELEAGTADGGES